jgi:hypothetical protein
MVPETPGGDIPDIMIGPHNSGRGISKPICRPKKTKEQKFPNGLSFDHQKTRQCDLTPPRVYWRDPSGGCRWSYRYQRADSAAFAEQLREDSRSF